MLLQVDGEPLVYRAAHRALSAGFDPLVVVVGHEAPRVQAALRDLPCRFAHNAAFRAATSNSLHRGLEQLPSDADGVVVLLGDMPHVTTGMLRTLHETARARSNPLVVSRYGDVIAPPLLFRRTLFPELRAWTEDGPGKAVARRHLSEAVTLDWPPAALADVDTPADFADLVDPEH